MNKCKYFEECEFRLIWHCDCSDCNYFGVKEVRDDA